MTENAMLFLFEKILKIIITQFTEDWNVSTITMSANTFSNENYSNNIYSVNMKISQKKNNFK